MTTPELDRLASEGARAESAIAVAPLTLPSHCSLLTGVTPLRHGVHDNSDYRLPDTQPTLATHLRSRGYGTAAVVGSIVLQGSLGLSRGFDVYDEPVRTDPSSGLGNQPGASARGRASSRNRTGASTPSVRPEDRGAAVSYEEILDRRASAVTDAGLRALGRLPQGKPFFLWVHYYDPHAEYDPPSPWKERFASRPYDGEIAYMDAEMGRLLDRLRKDGRLDKTLVAVVADHGESLGEHGEPTHGLFVYDATLRVPLILRMPGVIPSGTRIRGVVSGIDLAPTLLELLRQPPLPSVEGTSFAESASGRSSPTRPAVYSESQLPQRSYGWAPLHTLRDDGNRYIDAPDPELYDVGKDPGEARNLAATSPGRVREWQERLSVAMRSGIRGGADARSPMSQEDRERLASLGYLSGGERRAEPGRSWADPKSRVSLHVSLLAIKKMISAGEREGARKNLQAVLEVDPGNPAALSLKGVLDFSAGRRDEGLQSLEDAARRSPDVYENQANLANALHVAGRLAESAAVWKRALALRPAESAARYALGNVLFSQHETAGAIHEYEEAVRLGPQTPGLLAALGIARAEAGDAVGARASLKKAVAIDPSLTGAWNALGQIELRASRWNDALRSYDRSLGISPSDANALFGRGIARLRLGRRQEAEQDARRLAAEHPRFPPLGFLRGSLLLAAGDSNGAKREFTGFLSQPKIDPDLAEQARVALRRLAKRGGESR